YAGGDIKVALAFLAAIIDERALMIHGFPTSLTERLLFVQGLMAMLPPYARGEVTFSTRVDPPSIAYPHIVFHEDLIETPRYLANYHQEEIPDLSSKFPNGKLPGYSGYLLTLWEANTEHFLSAIDSMQNVAPQLLNAHQLGEGLATIAERHLL